MTVRSGTAELPATCEVTPLTIHYQKSAVMIIVHYQQFVAMTAVHCAPLRSYGYSPWDSCTGWLDAKQLEWLPLTIIKTVLLWLPFAIKSLLLWLPLAIKVCCYKYHSLPTVHCHGRLTTHYQPLTIHYQHLTIHYQHLTIHYQHLTIHYQPLTTHYQH